MALSLQEASPLNPNVAELPLLDSVAVDLHNCRKQKNLLHAKHAHLKALGNGLDTHQLGNFLVQMFVDCGSMCDAQKVFNKLSQPNEHSWTSLIQGYVRVGEHQSAVSLFKKMQQVQIIPTGQMYMALLKACGKLKWAEEGYAFHLDIVKHGIEVEPSVSDHIVDMYAKCGSFAEARSMFDGLTEQHRRLWTSLIVQYVEHGLHEEALRCLTQMQQQGVTPNDIALVSSLKACSSLGDLERGQIIHTEIIQEGHEEDIFIGNTLVDFYANSGLLVEAQEVFDGLSARDVVSWTALISGYAERGFGQEALECFDGMLLEAIAPNFVTYFSSLKACAITRGINKGRMLHMAVTMEGLEQEYLISSTLIDFYVKSGLLLEAQAVFDTLPARNVVLWTSLMTGYAEHGHAREALTCMLKMHAEGISADAATFVCILKVCGSLGLVESGFGLHLDIIQGGYIDNSYVGSTLVDMYARCGFLAEARAALEDMSVRSVVSWTALMDGYIDHGFGRNALACYAEMQSEGLSPNPHTFVCALKATMAVKTICDGQALHSSIMKFGYEKDLFIGCTLVDMYSKCGFLREAHESFNALPVRDSVVWNSLIISFVESKNLKQAFDYLRQMQEEGLYPNTMTWNAILMGFAEDKVVTNALELYQQMLDQGVTPDSLTFVSLLKACGNSAALETGRHLHSQCCNLCRSDVSEASEVILATSLIDMYSKCGSMGDAQRVFDEMLQRDLLVWTTLIAGYARHGKDEYVFKLIEKMQNEGLKLDEFTSFNALIACSHAGQVAHGTKFLEGMSAQYGLSPSAPHQNCAIDIFRRAGQISEAVTILREMPFLPDNLTWNTVLTACYWCADINTGQLAFEHVAYLDDSDGSAYILMSNIYADNDTWEDSMWLDETDLPEIRLQVETSGHVLITRNPTVS